MLSVCFDDSGTHSSSEIVLWFGLFGQQNQWDFFNDQWAKVLKDSCPGRDPIRHFHMTECQQSLGEFSGWKRIETDFIVDEFVKVIVAAGLFGNGLAIARADYERLMTGNIARAFGDAEGYCLRICYVRSLMWARKHTTDPEISFIFDQRRQEENNRIFGVFQRYASNEQMPPQLKSIDFKLSKDYLALQGADLVAWEFYRHAIDCLKGRSTKKLPQRRPLSRLMRGGRIQVGFAGPANIKKIAASLCNVDPEKIANVAALMSQ